MTLAEPKRKTMSHTINLSTQIIITREDAKKTLIDRSSLAPKSFYNLLGLKKKRQCPYGKKKKKKESKMDHVE